MNPLKPFTPAQRLIVGVFAAAVSVSLVQALTWGFGQQTQGHSLDRHFAAHRASEAAVVQARTTGPSVPMALEASAATRPLDSGRS